MTFPAYRSIPKRVQLTRRLQRDLEVTEADSWRPFYTIADPDFHTFQIDDTLVAGIPAVDLPIFNRVLGLGMSSLVLSSYIDEIIEFYQTIKSERFMVQLSPYVIPQDTEDLLVRKGFTYQDRWVKLLWNKNFVPPIADTTFTIEKIGSDEASIYQDVILAAFGWPAAIGPALAASLGKPGFQHHLVLEGDQVIGAGAMFMDEDFATLKFGAILPNFRNQGAHLQLSLHHLQIAINAGCEWITAETEEKQPGSSPGAYKNLRRIGFEDAYFRKNFIYFT